MICRAPFESSAILRLAIHLVTGPELRILTDSFARALPIAGSKAIQRPSELEYRVPDKV
jgi:hypothetical protein